MNLNSINIYYSDKKSPPEMVTSVESWSIEHGVIVFLRSSGHPVIIPLNTIERIETGEEDSVDE